MAKYSIEDTTLTNIANAIRAKTGGTAKLAPAAMDEALNNIPTQGAKTVTPSTADQTAAAKGVFTTGAVTVKGDANLKAENIADGVRIFGVTGSHKGGNIIETCNFMCNAADRSKIPIMLPLYENGEVVYKASTTFGNHGTLISNVVCNDFAFYQKDWQYPVSAVENCEIAESLAPESLGGIKITAAKGETATVRITYNDF